MRTRTCLSIFAREYIIMWIYCKTVSLGEIQSHRELFKNKIKNSHALKTLQPRHGTFYISFKLPETYFFFFARRRFAIPVKHRIPPQVYTSKKKKVASWAVFDSVEVFSYNSQVLKLQGGGVVTKRFSRNAGFLFKTPKRLFLQISINVALIPSISSYDSVESDFLRHFFHHINRTLYNTIVTVHLFLLKYVVIF